MSEKSSKTFTLSEEPWRKAATDQQSWIRGIRRAWPVLLSGLSIGVLGILLSVIGNPRNSGICVSCFLENIAGSLGLHQDPRMMYIRPEIIGFLMGAFIISLSRSEFKVRGGSSPIIRFFIGFFLIVGCSVFLGCPIKMALRFSAGDLTAVAGALGLIAGVFVGVRYLQGGFHLGKSFERPSFGGYIMPAVMVLLLLGLLARPDFIGLSSSGPGSLHPAWFYSLLFGLAIGSLAQRSRFCVTGGIRNLFLTGDSATVLGVVGLVISAIIMALLFGQFHLGINGQPGVHLSHIWNFMGLFLVGIGSVLAGGCPFRQLILSGEGDLDAGMTIMGMLLGGGAVFTWGIRSTTAGPTLNGKIAVIAGLIFCFLVANSFRDKE